MKKEEWRREGQHGQGTFLPLQVIVNSSLFVLPSSFFLLRFSVFVFSVSSVSLWFLASGHS
jgi:hypothetical protein